MTENGINATEILLERQFLENKSIEELEREMEMQKDAQEALINKINEQWYKEEWEWDRVLNFDKNIDMIYLKIKEMKKNL